MLNHSSLDNIEEDEDFMDNINEYSERGHTIEQKSFLY